MAGRLRASVSRTITDVVVGVYLVRFGIRRVQAHSNRRRSASGYRPRETGIRSNRRRSADCCRATEDPLILRSNPGIRNLYGFPPTSLICHEKDIPTKGAPQKASSRIPPPHAYPRRTGDDQESSSKGPEATRCLATNRSVTLETFVESSLTETVAARAGWSWSARQVRTGLLDWGSWYQGVAVLP
jgi:hypothetical protein